MYDVCVHTYYIYIHTHIYRYIYAQIIYKLLNKQDRHHQLKNAQKTRIFHKSSYQNSQKIYENVLTLVSTKKIKIKPNKLLHNH